MAAPEPSRFLNVSGIAENDHLQQYVEVGTNMYLGTKDGITYKLVQTPDTKIRLVEAIGGADISLDVSKGSWKSSLTNDKSSGYEDEWVTSIIEPKLEASSCKGQGDQIGNSVISPPCSISSVKEGENILNNVSLDGILTDESGSQLTYTTLVSKPEQRKTVNNAYYATPRGSYMSYSTPPTFPPPFSIRPARCTRNPRMQLIPGTSLFSPIPRASRARMRGRTRQRRPRRNACQYGAQVLHSTPTTKSSMDFSTGYYPPISDSSSPSSDSFSKSQTSIEYPRVPNNTPTSAEGDSAENQKVYSLQWIPHVATGVENYVSLNARKTHNEKERYRRLRIKHSCDAMRSLLPCVADRLDNASIFEHAVQFIAFVRETIGNVNDVEFVEQNFIY